MNERIKGKSPHEEEATMNKTTKQIFQEVANGANLKLKDTKLRVALKVKRKFFMVVGVRLPNYLAIN